MKYRKKPIVIEAVLASSIIIPSQSGKVMELPPPWVVDALVGRHIVINPNCVFIKTLEGEMVAQPDDYIIQGIQGEIYPCKPDIFHATYDEVEEG